MGAGASKIGNYRGEPLTRIIVESKSGPDGVLHLHVPVDQPDTAYEVELVAHPKSPGVNLPPGYFDLIGSIDDDTFVVHPQPPLCRTRGTPMDQATLVEHQIEDVPRLINQLKQHHCDVKDAFWLYSSEAEQWFLYLVSDVVDQKGITEAYRIVYKALSQLADVSAVWINPFEVKLVSPSNRIAKAVSDLLSKQRAPVPTRVQGANVGDVYIETAYIYARVAP